MIGRLTGTVVEDDADGTVILDVHGVGYEVSLPLGTLGRTPKHPDTGYVTLFVHSHVREDAFTLFGFASKEERTVFQILIGLSNIGPKIAMAVLGALTVEELATAIQHGHTSKLTGVPGIGKKTAERIVLELKDKKSIFPTHVGSPVGSVQSPPVPKSEKSELLVGALTRMGFRPAEVDRAVALLGNRVQELELSELVREALAVLSLK